MKKRLISLLIIFALVFTLIPNAFADDNYDPDDWIKGRGDTETGEVPLVGEPKPVSITAEAMEFIEYSHGSWYTYYDTEEPPYTEEYTWFEYNVYPQSLTVTMSDGSTVVGSSFDLWLELDIHPGITTDQSKDNQWGVGKHTAQIEFGEITGTVEVNILPSPVKELSVDDITIFENTGGYYSTYYIEDGEEDWYQYNLNDFISFTAILQDGTKLKGNRYNTIFEIDGEFYSPQLLDGQDYYNQWGVGEHKATVFFCGKTAEVNVKIISSPISALNAEPISVIKDVDGYNWDDFFAYSYDEFLSATAVLKDGGSAKAQYGLACGEYCWYFDFDGALLPIEISDTQDEEHWDLGEHSAKLTCGKDEFNVTVTVIESPVVKVEAEPITLMEGIDGWSYEDTFEYYIPDEINLKVFLKDGTVIDVQNSSYALYKGKQYFIDKGDSSTLKIGENIVKCSVMGMTFERKIVCEENAFSSLTISGENELTLTFTKKDGSKETHKALNFEAMLGSPYGEVGLFVTDKKTFSNVELRWKQLEDWSIGTEEFCIFIGDMKSNVLPKCNWLKATSFNSQLLNDSLYHYSYNNGFENNVDDTLALAFNVKYIDTETELIDGKDYFVADSQTVAQQVAKVFKSADYDFTTSSYFDSDKNLYYIPVFNYGGYDVINTDFSLEFSDGEWTSKTEIDGRMLVFTFNNDLLVTSTFFGDHTPGDINNDGKVNAKDLTRLLKHLNKEDVEVNPLAVDVNGDGKVNAKDLTRLLKYLNHEDVEIF